MGDCGSENRLVPLWSTWRLCVAGGGGGDKKFGHVPLSVMSEHGSRQSKMHREGLPAPHSLETDVVTLSEPSSLK